MNKNAKWQDAELTDTSDEEEIRNTVGNIPLEWYDEYSHCGYDIEGKKIPKPLSAGKDEVTQRFCSHLMLS